jgi:glycosyltransferase involved in cell wall biosynthesis
LKDARSTRLRLVVIGTDRASVTGGVASVISGFLPPFERRGLLGAYFVTHRDSPTGWFAPAAAAAPRVVAAVRRLRRDGHDVVVYGHAGGMLSVARITTLLRAARAAGAATVLQMHSVTVGSWLGAPGRSQALRTMVGAADVVTASTQFWRDAFAAHRLGVCRVVPNPLPPDAQAAVARPPSRRRTGPGLVVGTMTRLVPGKGTDLLIEALPLGHPEDRLRVAGAGPMTDALRARARELGVEDRVEWVGWIGADDKDAFLSSLDVFALPSTYDSFGMGLIEAMARGMPAIALAGGGAAEVIRPGVDGALAARATPDAVAAAIASLRDEGVRSAASVAARDRVRDVYGAEAVADAALRAAEEAISLSRSRR